MMKRMLLGVLVLLAVGFGSRWAQGEIYQIDLLKRGCPEELGDGGEEWDYDFDFGVEFSSIESVGMIWSGQFKGTYWDNEYMPDEIRDLRVYAYMSLHGAGTKAAIEGGKEAYPGLASYDTTTLFTLDLGESWTALLDGQDYLIVKTPDTIGGTGPETVWGYVTFDSLILQIEGTPVPEPATLFLVLAGGIALRRRSV